MSTQQRTTRRRRAPQKLSERQKKMLAYIESCYKDTGYPPTIREIGMAVNIASTSVVNYNLNKLEQAEYIKREKKVSRGLRLLKTINNENFAEVNLRLVDDQRDYVSVPMVGQIVASEPVPIPGDDFGTFYDPDDVLELPTRLLGKQSKDGEIFALRVNGESMIDALDHEQRDLHATLAAYRTATGEQWDTAQNHGLRKTDIDNDTEQFFRAVDRAIMAHYSLPSGLPLILATLPEHHHLFRRASRNKQLMDEGIKINASALPTAELKRLAWELFEPRYNERLDVVIGEFRHAAAKRLGVNQIDQIAKDAFDGKVGTLLLEENRIIPGRIVDRDNVLYHDLDSGDQLVDDVLDDLAELVLRFGGEVWIVPKDRMPAETGAAAINRF